MREECNVIISLFIVASFQDKTHQVAAMQIENNK